MIFQNEIITASYIKAITLLQWVRASFLQPQLQLNMVTDWYLAATSVTILMANWSWNILKDSRVNTLLYSHEYRVGKKLVVKKTKYSCLFHVHSRKLHAN